MDSTQRLRKDQNPVVPEDAIGLADKLQTKVLAAKTPAASCNVSPGLYEVLFRKTENAPEPTMMQTYKNRL